jgi:hypothetical protein
MAGSLYMREAHVSGPAAWQRHISRALEAHIEPNDQMAAASDDQAGRLASTVCIAVRACASSSRPASSGSTSSSGRAIIPTWLGLGLGL